MLKRILVPAVCICALVLVAAAFASGPATLVKTYGGLAAAAGSQVKPKGPAATQVQATGTLPFTGRDLAVVFGAGLVLAASGAALRQFGHRKS